MPSLVAMLGDLRFGLRMLVRAPVVSAVAILTLGLGIGANAGMFSVVNAVLLRPLPYRAPDRLVAVWTRFLPPSGYDFPFFSLSGPEALDYQRETKALASVAPYSWRSVNLTSGENEPERAPALAASAELFPVLGVDAAVGRTFTRQEDEPGGPCVVLLSHGLWHDRFGARPDLPGRSIQVDGQPCTVVGIMPESFYFPDKNIRLWVPLGLSPVSAGDRESHSLAAVGRLQNGISIDAARAEAQKLMAGWERAFPDHHRGHFIVLDPLHTDQVRFVRSALLVLMGAVLFVLLIVCSNVANLLLARAESRRREMAVRATLGAGRFRLLRQLLTESLLLAALGGGLGLLAAAWTLDALLALYPRSLPTVTGIRIDGNVLAFTTVVSLASVLLFGLAPAFSIGSGRLSSGLQAEGRTSSGGRRRMTAHGILVVAEVALSLVLLVGAGLLMQSFARLSKVNLGFNPEGILTLTMSSAPGRQAQPAEVRQLYADILSRVEALPEVESAGLISALPLERGAPPDDFRIEGRPQPAPGETAYNADHVMATPGLFETLRIPLVRGRLFEPGDVLRAPLVALINEATARKFWPNDDPIGKRIRYFADDAPWLTIVGIVGDVRSRQLEAEPRPAVYVPHAQASRGPSYDETGIFRFMSLAVRGGSPEPIRDGGGAPSHAGKRTPRLKPGDLAASVRAVIRERDPALPVSSVMTMDDVVARAAAQPKFTSLLMGLFAGTALFLALIGIYGVMTFAVEQARHAIGIRMALGATRGEIVHDVVARGARIAGLGVAVGTLAALLLGRSLSTLLYHVSPTDPLTLGSIALVLVAVSLLASYLPARRAARVDPIEALRYD